MKGPRIRLHHPHHLSSTDPSFARPAIHRVPDRRTHSGGEGNRTPDLLNAIQALSQLSYAPDAARRVATGTKKAIRG